MLTDRGEHHAQEPAFASCGAGLLEQIVILLALVGTLDTTMMVVMLPPEFRVAREGCEESVVGLGIGVDDPPVG